MATVPDGSGGSYIAWEDFRDGNPDIYLLRFSNGGQVAPGWPANGLAVCTAGGYQVLPFLVPDGNNGVIVGWTDQRGKALEVDGYAQRVTPAGATLWTANGVKVLSQMSFDVVAAPDGSGGLLLAWSQSGDIFALRIDSNGGIAAGWNAGGTLVLTSTDDESFPTITPDGSGGAIVAWEGNGGAPVGPHVFAQRLNASGAPQWASSGVKLDGGISAYGGAVCSDGAGGAFVFWSEGSVHGQHLDGSGVAQWAPVGVEVSGAGASVIAAVRDGLGGSLLVLNQYVGGGPTLFGQRVDPAGAAQWGSDGVAFATSSDPNNQPSLEDVVPEGAGGASFVWTVYSSASGSSDLLAQHANATGTLQWTATGVPVCTGDGERSNAGAAPDGAGGLMIAWLDTRNVDTDVFVQRLDNAGAPQFAANGTPLYGNPGVQLFPLVVPDDAGGTFVAWADKRNGQYDVRARRLGSDGVPLGTTANVCSAAGQQFLQAAIPDGSGGAILAWIDTRDGIPHIYAQRLDASAAPQWTPDGVQITFVDFGQSSFAIASDGAGGAIIAWEEGYDPTAGLNIFAQRVNQAGSLQWTDGVKIGRNDGNQGVAIASDGAGGAVIAWFDISPFPFPTPVPIAQRVDAGGVSQWTDGGVGIAIPGNFYALSGAVPDGAHGAIVLFAKFGVGTTLQAQRVDGSGARQWGDDGATVCDASSFAVFERIVDDGAGGAIIAWSDDRNLAFDAYAQRLDASGAAQWGTNGTPVCSDAGWQTLGSLSRDAGGNAVLAWSDERGGLSDVYAQRLNTSGGPLWQPGGVKVSGAPRGQFAPALMHSEVLPYRDFVAWTDHRSGDSSFVYAQRLDINGVSQWAGDGTTSTQLSLVSSEAASDHVRLSWYASEDVMATVYRRQAEGGWLQVGETRSTGTGLLIFEDRQVTPGSRYGYRLGLRQTGGEVFSGEVWVLIPSSLKLALHGLMPNPATGELRVSFTLPGEEPAAIELIDVTGRRLLRRELVGLRAGDYTLGVSDRLPPAGIYFVRLTQAGHVVSARGAVMP